MHNNLYFYDLAGKKSHVNAIFVCQNLNFPYEIDENGYPVFNPEKNITYKDFYITMQEIFRQKPHLQEKETLASVRYCGILYNE